MGQKYAAYDATGAITGYYDDSINPASQIPAQSIKITDTQWQACINTQGYTVANSVLVAPTPATAAQQLASAQAAQTAKITASCSSAILAGFSSAALGTSRSYPAKQTDQLNLNGSVTSALVALASPAWAASKAYTVGQTVVMGGVPYVCSVAGTSGATAPVWPTATGIEVADGTAKWKLWTTPFWCADAAGNWSYTDHTASQIQQAGQDGKAAILTNLNKCQNYINQINAATTVAAVQAIVWQ